MEIKIGNCDNIIEDPQNAYEYGMIMERVVECLFLLSGIKRNEEQISALGRNMHRFLVENKEFVIGVINSGRYVHKNCKNNT